ncbi:MAG: DNA-directed RNA polymerase subunit RPC12/RpoP [Candidatus Azotimanducaceae bacterium]|jgi:DNA-directed RNA polymerase subunit RPC12/RpoP
MAYQCEECGYEVTRRNSLCEDWDDEDRSFGCPKCGTFYRRVGKSLKSGNIGGFLAAGVGTPAGILFGYGLQTDDKLVLLLSSVVLLSLLGLLVLTSSKLGVSYQPSGYRAEVDSKIIE